MNRSILLGLTTAAMLAGASPLCAMGGGGGGMGGYGSGGYGGPGAGSGGMDDYSMAVQFIRHEKYEQAVPYLDRALLTKPHNANILNYLGYTHRMLGDYPGSLAFYQKALTEDPDHKGAHEYLGELYLMMHDSASADGQLAELTRLCPDDCEERDVLTKAIADYHAKAHAAAAAAQSAPADSTAPAQPPAPAQPATTTTN